jgi:uncharacterized protein (DUF58 family)
VKTRKSHWGRRILFVFMMVVLLFSGLYSGERIYFVGLITMALMLALSAVSLIYTALTFKYLQKLTPVTGVKGDSLEYTVEVHNDMLFPIPYIKLYYDSIDSLLSGTQGSIMLSLMPRTYGERTESIYCRYRGRWPVGVKKVEIQDFFGLVCIQLDASHIFSHKPMTLLVRPRVLHLDHLPMRRKNDEGPMEAVPRSSEDMAMLSDIRKYRPGDQMKKIHWKLTARQHELMVKNYEESSLPDLLLYIDTHESPLGQMDRLNTEDTLVESATAVLHYLMESSLPTSLIFFGDKRMQIRGSRPEHFQTFYTVLSEMPFDGKWAAEDVLLNDLKLVTHAGNLFLVTRCMSDKLFDLLMLMNSSSLNLTVIYVYEPESADEPSIMNATKLGRTQRMISEMRNAGILVIDLKPGENFVERVAMLR